MHSWLAGPGGAPDQPQRGRPALRAGGMALGLGLLVSAGGAAHALQRDELGMAPAHTAAVAAGPLRPSIQPLAVVTGVAPGQAGYVHFFELTLADGSIETQVGVEIDDQRIAWSVPNVGPLVSAFVREGEVTAGAVVLRMRHSYGLRPFDDDARMRALQHTLLARVTSLVDDGLGYCNDPDIRSVSCMSCLAFALELIFPGPYPLPPRLPVDFRRSRDKLHYTTEDFLLYLARLDDLPTREARRQRVDQMQIPPPLREDLLALIAATDPAERSGITTVAGSDAATAAVPAAPVRARAKGSLRRPALRKL